MDPAGLSIFISRINGICEEMGEHLRRAAFSTNIRDRLDYSCAVFDPQGHLLAQSADIPVHLGSMAFALRDIIDRFEWSEGDMVVFNDPFSGGTHLPDVTLLGPFFHQGKLCGFVANRAHHSDIGSDSPGSMPLASHLEQEGILIMPRYLIKEGALDQSLLAELTEHLRSPDDAKGDYMAQISANQIGMTLLVELLAKIGLADWQSVGNEINDYGKRLAEVSFSRIPDGEYTFSDMMDDDGFGHRDIKIQVCLRIKGAQIEVDFAGTADQVEGNINCPKPVTAAATYYVFRCLLPEYAPTCQGVFSWIQLSIPDNCILNAQNDHAVAAGNTETSQRVVDCLLGALAEALPDVVAAASQGTMNNIALGNIDGDEDKWSYYETVGGGMGASEGCDGYSAVQTHMTNTRNTPAEILEMRYPLRIHRYQIRRGSGGEGRFSGGDGLIREFEFLKRAEVTLLTERRVHQPWGAQGGGAGASGENQLNGETVGPKASFRVKVGDRLSIATPGGGGWGH